MSHRTQADCLVTNIDWLITVDRERRIIRDAGIAIGDGRFLAVGKSAEIAASWVANEIAERAVEFVREQKSPRLKASVSFRGLSNSTDKLIEGCREVADKHGCILQTHACFNYSTHDDCLANFGATEIERLENLGVLDERTLLVHSGCVVEMATVNGARCAGLADSLGSVEAGKQADLVLFDTAFPEWQPLYNPVSNLVYSATGNSVSDVFVAGERVVKKGHLTKVDEAEIFKLPGETVARMSKKLKIERLVKLRWPVI